MIGIPSEYLAKMGVYSIKIEGVEFKAKVVDLDCSSTLMDKHIDDIRSALETSPRVVGVAIKRLSTDDGKPYYSDYDHDSHESLVLCAGANCLIIHLPNMYYSCLDEGPEVLVKFLQDSSICFVGDTRRPKPLGHASSWGVEVGVLAAMVLKKPSLTGSSLAEIAREVGLQYEEPHNQIGESTTAIKVDTMNPTVLSEDQVELTVTDAYVCYKIGYKLLNSL